MAFKSIVFATTILVLSTTVNAAIIEANWQSVGDITRDTASGLDWLDLTETLGMTYSAVEDQLGTGGQFEGFRFATADEVIGLWANWGVNLAPGADMIKTGDKDQGMLAGVLFLGNTTYDEDPAILPEGALGFANSSDGWIYRMGALWDESWDGRNAYNIEGQVSINPLVQDPISGSYLVQVSAVPVPAAAWLFGSGLLGLVGMARRKA